MHISGRTEPYVEFYKTPKHACGRPKPPPPPRKPSTDYEPSPAAKSVTATVVLRSKVDDSGIRGIASLDNRLYVLHVRSKDQLDELDVHDLRLQRRLSVPAESCSHLADMASCPRRRRLFISHDTSNCVHVVTLTAGEVWTKWETDGSPWGLSVSPGSGNLLVTLRYAACVDEFSAEGRRLRRVDLQRGGVFNPWHAVQLGIVANEPEVLVVGHGDRDDDAVRVGFVRVLDGGRSSVGERWYAGSAPGTPLSRPQHLAVGRNGTIVVVDAFNARVVLLDDSLRLAGVLDAFPHDRMAGWRSSRVCWIGRRLCVAEVKVIEGKFAASRLIIYDLH